MGVVSEVRWSFSRSKSLSGCLRAHWFQYYVNGEPEQVEAAHLRNLQTPHMLLGKVVEEVVNEAMASLRADQPIRPDLVDHGIARWNLRLAQSAEIVEKILAGKTYRTNPQPLDRHYYGQALTDTELDQLQERVRKCLEGFLASGLLTELCKLNRAWWDLIKTENDRAIKWDLDEVPVSSALDFHVHRPGRWLCIIDWKSGFYTDEDDGLQLASYSLWGQQAKGLPPERVRVQHARLVEAPDLQARVVSTAELEAARATVRAQHAKELSYLERTAWPNGRSAYLADRSAFPPRPSVRACTTCKFRAICPDKIAAERP